MLFFYHLQKDGLEKYGASTDIDIHRSIFSKNKNFEEYKNFLKDLLFILDCAEDTHVKLQVSDKTTVSISTTYNKKFEDLKNNFQLISLLALTIESSFRRTNLKFELPIQYSVFLGMFRFYA